MDHLRINPETGRVAQRIPDTHQRDGFPWLTWSWEPGLNVTLLTEADVAEWMRYPKVEILRLEPGDVLAVKAPDRLTASEAAKIKEQFTEQFPDHKVLLYSGMDLAVVRPCPEPQPPDPAA
jgi:hypothetical protein